MTKCDTFYFRQTIRTNNEVKQRSCGITNYLMYTLLTYTIV